ncbi:MAG: hypothetical protein ROR55_26925 [Devosia sp.]
MRFLALPIAALGLSLAVASADASERLKYEAIFAEAESVKIGAQVAGTYPARSEVLVKLRNNNQYAVPVVPGSDLSVWRENALIDIIITQGLIVDVRRGGEDIPFTYTVVTDTDVIEGAPSDKVVREIRYTTTIREVGANHETVVFEAEAGDQRLAVVSTPESLKEMGIKAGDRVDLVYFDEIDIESR